MSVERSPRPLFTDSDLPLTASQLREREKWMMESGNWREDHSIPSVGDHYRYMWKWDSYKAIVINARRGDLQRATTEFFALERYRDVETGFLSNKIFATADRKTWRDYPEAWFFNNNKVGTSYSQPPLAAWSATEIFNGLEIDGREEEGLQFLAAAYGAAEQGNYTGLQGEYAYFINHRQNSPDDPLIGIVHPNETGRDSDEANKPWVAFSDKKPDPRIEWLQMQKLGWDLGRIGRDPRRKRIDWIPDQVRQRYWVNDVMFNTMYASNLRHMGTIARRLMEFASDGRSRERYDADTHRYNIEASAVEQQVLGRMWDPKEKFFYNLDSRGNKIPVDSVTGLFPLMLENIAPQQTAALAEKLEDPTWFATPYPIPTHAVRSRFYDPEPTGFKNKFTPQWSGTVWLDVNHIIGEEGLVPRAQALINVAHEHHDPQLALRLLGIAGVIAANNKALLSLSPKTMEYYSPISGIGMRVADFMWTNIGLHAEKYERAVAHHLKPKEVQ